MYGFTRVAAAYETIVGEATGRDWIGWLTARLTAVDGAALARLWRPTAVLILVGGVLAGAYGGRRGWAASALVVGLFLVVCVGIGVGFKELPLRLLAPLACGFLAALLVTVGSLRRPAASPVPVVLCLGVVLVVLAYEGRAVAVALAADRRHSLQVDGEVERFLRLKPSLVVRHSDTFPAEHWWRPFHQPAVPMTTITLGRRNNQSPQLRRFLSGTARQPLVSALCEDPSILVVAEAGATRGRHHVLSGARGRVGVMGRGLCGLIPGVAVHGYHAADPESADSMRILTAGDQDMPIPP